MNDGINIIILSDRRVGPDRVPIPSLLATAGRASSPDPQGPAHLRRPRRRDPASRARCIISAASPATARKRSTPISPSRRCSRSRTSCRRSSTEKEIVKRYIKAIGKGLLKVMSKMGISTYQSYCGAQIFDAVGLKTEFVEPLLRRHRDAHRGRRPRRDRARKPCAAIARPSATLRSAATLSTSGGEYAFRIRGEEHVWTRRRRGAAARGARQHAGQVPRRSQAS